MTVKLTVTSIKPADVNFPEYDMTLDAHMTNNYINTGKLLSKHTSSTKINESDDSFDRRTFTMVFDSAASFDEFNADPVRMAARAARDAYFTEHGITNTTVIEYIAPDVQPA